MSIVELTSKGKIKIKRGMSDDLKAHIHQLNTLKSVDPELGTWYDAKKFKPVANGSYLTILESGARNRDSQSWAGMGDPETASYNTNYDSSPLNNWSGRGTLRVAFFTAMPIFDKTWEKGIFNECGKWIDPA